MNPIDIDDPPSTSDEVASRVFEQFTQIVSACNCLCSLGYSHGWPIRLGASTTLNEPNTHAGGVDDDAGVPSLESSRTSE